MKKKEESLGEREKREREEVDNKERGRDRIMRGAIFKLEGIAI